jgi:hypothetical protein
MTLGAGAVAIKRLRFLSLDRTLTLKEIAKRLKGAALSPLAMDDTREESLGFVHPYTGEPDFSDIHELVYRGSLVLGLRKDSKKIPGTLFRLQLKAALEALSQAAPKESKSTKSSSSDEPSTGKAGRRRLSKALKEQAKERIKAELMRRTLPSVRLTEFVWHLDAGEVWLLSTSQSVFEDFEKLFFECFQMSFVQIGPGTSALDFDRLHQGLPVALEPYLNLVPVGFVDHSPHVSSAARSATAENSKLETKSEEPIF